MRTIRPQAGANIPDRQRGPGFLAWGATLLRRRWLLDLTLLGTVLTGRRGADRRGAGRRDASRPRTPAWVADLMLVPLILAYDLPYCLSQSIVGWGPLPPAVIASVSAEDPPLPDGQQESPDWATLPVEFAPWHPPVPSWLADLAFTALTLTVVLRHRWPGRVFLLQLALCAAATAISKAMYCPILAMLVALYALGTSRSPAVLRGAAAACLIPIAARAAARWGLIGDVGFLYTSWQDLVRNVLSTVLDLVLPVAVAVVAHRVAVTARRERDAVAEGRRAAIAITRQAAVAEARRGERLFIARDLHDILSHSVTTMMLQAAGARSVLATDPLRATEALDVVQTVGQSSMAELRQLLQLLRTATGADENDASAQPGFDSVDILVEEARAAGLTIDVVIDGDPGALDPAVGVAGYRFVREALINTRKHAGPGARATLRIAWDGEWLSVTVEDHQPGVRPTAAPSTGHGLLGLRERLATVGAEMHAEPTADGFLTLAVLPVARPPHPTVTPTPP